MIEWLSALIHHVLMIRSKKAPEGAFFDQGEESIQSRSPPMMPSKASKLWNTLKMSKYKAKVALM